MSFPSIRRERALLAAAALGLAGGITAAQTEPRLATKIIATGLEHPWALAFLPDGRYLVTERPGRMRVVEADGRLNAPLAGVPAVAAAGQGGLLDLVLDSDFAHNRRLYFCFSEPGQGQERGGHVALIGSAVAVDVIVLRRRNSVVVSVGVAEVGNAVTVGVEGAE